MGLAGFRNKKQFHFEPYYAGRQDRMGLDNFYNYSQELMESIYNSQQQQRRKNQKENNDQHQTIFFSFTRDPVKRFVSSVGEALQISKDLSPCERNNTTEAMLLCVLDKIETDSSYLNEHLVPQSFEFYRGIIDCDIGIDLTDISNLPAVLQQMGVAKTPKARSAVGLIEGFNLTVSALTPAMIDKICELYAMDVEMLRMTGVSPTGCEITSQQ